MTTATTSDLAIDLVEVAKTYGRKVHALRGIEMRVGRGEVFGLLGPNGAGKSTLVKILMTVIRASRCRGTMLGCQVGDKDALRRVGYLPEHHKFPDYLTGRQVLDYFASLSGVDRDDRKRRIPEMLDLLGMGDWADTRVKKYSKGMRQRTGIAQALMSDPDLVLLDEPTDGVDPVGRRDIRDVVRELSDRGKTVFINSHLLSELEMVCDRVAILVQGRVVAQGTIDELTEGQRRYEIDVADGARLDAALGSARGLPSFEVDGPRVVLSTVEARDIQPAIDAIRGAGIEIRAIRSQRPSLEDLFMAAVTDPTTGKEYKPGASKEPRERTRPTNGEVSR